MRKNRDFPVEKQRFLGVNFTLPRLNFFLLWGQRVDSKLENSQYGTKTLIMPSLFALAEGPSLTTRKKIFSGIPMVQIGPRGILTKLMT